MTRNKKKILFITAPYHAGVVEVAGKWLPLYMVCIAGACQKAGYDIEIFDAMTKGVGIAAISDCIKESKANFVAVSTITSTAIDAMSVLAEAKKIDSNIITIAGGIHASFMYEDLFRENSFLDFVVIGEGETTLVELLDTLVAKGDLNQVEGLAFPDNGQIKVNKARPLLADLDNMPMAWDALDWDDYTYFIIPGSRLGAIATSRGCEHQCTFCSQHKFWQKSWRARSAEDVVCEIEELFIKYAVNVVLFTDDYPTPDRKHWEAILDLLIEKDLPVYILMETRAEDIVRDKDILHKYRQAGIIHIYIGTESASQKRLDVINKEQTVWESKEALRLCREHDIITETSVIMGFPDDTVASLEIAITNAIEMNPDFAHFLAIAPWPYADIYPELKPYIEEFDFRKYNLIEPILKPRDMTKNEVDKMIIEGYRRFYQQKFAEIMTCDAGFKREYMLTAMKRMMNHSFIKKKLQGLHHAMPEEMKEIIRSAS